MSKTLIVGAVATETGQSRRNVRRTIDAFLNCTIGELSKGWRITFGGFGTFRVQQRKARKGINPQTGETLIIPARRVVRFKAGTDLREAVR